VTRRAQSPIGESVSSNSDADVADSRFDWLKRVAAMLIEVITGATTTHLQSMRNLASHVSMITQAQLLTAESADSGVHPGRQTRAP